MFWVMTAFDEAALLELRERAVGVVWLLRAELVEARAVVAPEASRVRVEGVDVGDLHRIDVLPEARAGRAEVRDARRHRDARAR